MQSPIASQWPVLFWCVSFSYRAIGENENVNNDENSCKSYQVPINRKTKKIDINQYGNLYTDASMMKLIEQASELRQKYK